MPTAFLIVNGNGKRPLGRPGRRREDDIETYLKYMGLNGVEWDKVKVKFALEQATKAQRGDRGIALLFL